MKRIFQNIKTGELIYFANDDSPEFRKFLTKWKKAGNDKYLEFFTTHDG